MPQVNSQTNKDLMKFVKKNCPVCKYISGSSYSLNRIVSSQQIALPARLCQVANSSRLYNQLLPWLLKVSLEASNRLFTFPERLYIPKLVSIIEGVG